MDVLGTLVAEGKLGARAKPDRARGDDVDRAPTPPPQKNRPVLSRAMRANRPSPPFFLTIESSSAEGSPAAGVAGVLGVVDGGQRRTVVMMACVIAACT